MHSYRPYHLSGKNQTGQTVRTARIYGKADFFFIKQFINSIVTVFPHPRSFHTTTTKAQGK